MTWSTFSTWEWSGGENAVPVVMCRNEDVTNIDSSLLLNVKLTQINMMVTN
jgi:hypothetical protein